MLLFLFSCIFWFIWCFVACVIIREKDRFPGIRCRGLKPPTTVRQGSMEYHGTLPRSAHKPDFRRRSLYLELPDEVDDILDNRALWQEHFIPPQGRFMNKMRPPQSSSVPNLVPFHRREFSSEYLPSSSPYRMTDSLTEIQGDIQRLSHQQHQIHSMMHNGAPNHHQSIHPQHQSQFYLHDQVGYCCMCICVLYYD